MNTLCSAYCTILQKPLSALSCVAGLGVSLYGLRKITTDGLNLKTSAIVVAGAALSAFSMYSLFMPNQPDHQDLHQLLIKRAVKEVVTNLEGLSTVQGLVIACKSESPVEGIVVDCLVRVPQNIIVGENFGRNESTICTIIKHMSSYIVSTSAPVSQ